MTWEKYNNIKNQIKRKIRTTLIGIIIIKEICCNNYELRKTKNNTTEK